MKTIIISMTVAALTMLAATASAQAGPFKQFEGSWSGAGTVSLSDGSKEKIRCRANHKADETGDKLTLALRCASDSYKFDLSSDVSSQAGALSGNWSEASRNINGNLQGRVDGGRITVFVEAAGFAANLSIITRGQQQSVSITSKGEIRSVSITMVKA